MGERGRQWGAGQWVGTAMGPAGAQAGGAEADHGAATRQQVLGIPCRLAGWAAQEASSNHLLSFPLSAGLRGGRGGR